MIIFSREPYESILTHATDGVPYEICGVLAGTYGDQDPSRVTRAFPAENVAETPKTEYLIDPEEQFALMEQIEAAGDAVVGYYHSHPAGPPYPSPTDEQRATWPGLSYCIISLHTKYPFIGSWRWNDTDNTFEQEIVRLDS